MKNDYGCRVAANARLLYARLAVSTTVEMVVARLVLDALGVNGYGLFAAASGGLAALFFFNGALEAAARRFVCHDKANFAPLLGLTLTLSGIVGLVGIALSVAAFTSSASLLFPLLGVLVLNVLRLPYEACVVAGERMGFFLGLSLAESALSLLSALAIPLSPFCPLTTYATLRLVSAVLASAIVLAYCRRHYAESRARPVFRFSGSGGDSPRCCGDSSLLRCERMGLQVEADFGGGGAEVVIGLIGGGGGDVGFVFRSGSESSPLIFCNRRAIAWAVLL